MCKKTYWSNVFFIRTYVFAVISKLMAIYSWDIQKENKTFQKKIHRNIRKTADSVGYSNQPSLFYWSMMTGALIFFWGDQIFVLLQKLYCQCQFLECGTDPCKWCVSVTLNTVIMVHRYTGQDIRLYHSLVWNGLVFVYVNCKTCFLICYFILFFILSMFCIPMIWQRMECGREVINILIRTCTT